MFPSLINDMSSPFLQAHLDEKKFPGKSFPLIFPFEISPSLEVNTVIGSEGIAVAASMVAFNTKAPVNNRPNFGTVTNRLGAIRIAREMDELEFEKLDQLNRLAGQNPDSAIKNQVIKIKYDDSDYVVKSCGAMIEYLAVHTLFNQKIIFNTTNNPKGLKTDYGIDFRLAAAHKRSIESGNANRVWSVANKATMLPLTDAKVIKQTARDEGYETNWLFMNQSRFDIFAQADEVIQNVFQGQTVPALLLSPDLDQINAMMRRKNLPQIVVIDSSVRFEAKDGTFTTVDPALTPDLGVNSDKYVIFTQELKQGETKYKPTMEEVKPVPGVVYGKSDNILVAKYSEGNPRAEQTVGMINAFPSFPTIDSLFRLNTVDNQADGLE